MKYQRVIWRKSSYSNGNGGACIEVAELHTSRRGVRDSKDPLGTVLTVSRAQWAAFTGGVSDGQFI